MRRLALPQCALAACAIFGLASGQGTRPPEPGDKSFLWVFLSYEEGPQAFKFNGRMKKTDFDALVAGEAKGLVALEEGFIVRDGGFEAYANPELGFTNTMYVHAKGVCRVIPLESKFVEKALKQRVAPQPRFAPAERLPGQGPPGFQ